MKQLFSLSLVLFFAVTANARPFTGSEMIINKQAVAADGKKNEMVIVPDPSSNSVQIKIKVEKAAAGTIIIYDNTGKLVSKQEAALQAGNNSIVLNDVLALNEGSYTVTLKANKATFSAKFLIWK